MEDSRIRERLKAMPVWKKDLVTKRTKGPVVSSVINGNCCMFGLRT